MTDETERKVHSGAGHITGGLHLPQQKSAWVAEMHEYFGTHGHFRPADLDRVLGSPLGFTEGKAITESAGNFIARKK